MGYTVRPARTGDVRAIRGLINANVASGRLLDKPTVTLYEDIQEFVVAAGLQGQGVGDRLVRALLGRATALGVRRVFVLTFAVSFFGRYGFEQISGAAADPDVSDPEVFAELLRSSDEGVAEFLDLDRVKPNTLGNTRMLLRL